MEKKVRTLKEIVQEQITIQENLKKNPKKYLTIGFEFDIAETTVGNYLQGMSHIRLAKLPSGFSELPYYLETDAGNTLELSTPPFFIEATENEGILLPNLESLQELKTALQQALNTIFDNYGTLYLDQITLLDWSQFIVDDEPAWEYFDLELQVFQFSGNSLSKAELVEDLKGYKIQGKISYDMVKIASTIQAGDFTSNDMQINIATNAYTFYDLNKRLGSRLEESSAYTFYNDFVQGVIKSSKTKFKNPVLLDFYEYYLQTLVYYIAVPALINQHEMQVEFMEAGLRPEAEVERQKEELHPIFRVYANLGSFVKDTRGLWLKTDLLTLGSALTQEDWEMFLNAALSKSEGFIKMILKDAPLKSLLLKDKRLAKSYRGKLNEEYELLLQILREKVELILGGEPEAFAARTEEVLTSIVKYQVCPEIIGVRPDTYIKMSAMAALSQNLGYEELLHVIEIRNSRAFFELIELE